MSIKGKVTALECKDMDDKGFDCCFIITLETGTAIKLDGPKQYFDLGEEVTIKITSNA